MNFISEETFREWKNHIVTETLIKQLTEERKHILTAWEEGQFYDPILNARMMGLSQAIKSLLDFNPVTETTEEDTTNAN